jgi:uncharacterized lipoprotein YddW (UPF0748 family)
MTKAGTSRRWAAWLVMVALAGCATGPATEGPPASPGTTEPLPVAEMPPAEPREFRAAWVATVANIDWPSRPGLPADVQRGEALALLERSRTLGLNALILQIRPAGDALYPSTLEPWSEYLSGEQGKPPAPAYDPLAFWVAEAHRRGLELHVWLNPYRARASSARTPLVAPHIGVRAPQLVKRYGDQLWMDPGESAAAAHTLAVVADVVQRYDIDGVHIDDYFYPYPVNDAAGNEQPFPDDASWAAYQLGGGTLARDDWRRASVDALVQQMHATVRRLKPWVRVGISPFGIGRPDRRPAGITGFSQYDKLYADVEKWFAEGWLDYLAPQLYWPVTRQGQEFPVLLDYWVGENKAGRHLWPGLFTSRIAKDAPAPAEPPPSGPGPWPAAELLRQVELTRQRPGAGGHIHFSLIALQQDRDGIATRLRQGPYAMPALVPATPWLDSTAPPAPQLAAAGFVVRLLPAAGEPAWLWAVWRRVGGSWRFATVPGRELSLDSEGADVMVVSAVDRTGNLSPRATVRLK